MGRIRLFFQMFGAAGLLRFAIYPLTLIVSTPVQLARSLRDARVLAGGNWGGITAYNARNGIAYLFYLTIADNLRRFGRRGRSPYAGLGDYPLSKWFLYCVPSIFVYRWLTPLVPIVGMFGWLGAHLLWTREVPGSWVFVVLALALISTSFYGNLFAYQNYNVLGWMFFPAGLYGALTGHWAIAAAAWLAASFASTTVIAIAVAASAVIAITTPSIGPLLAVVPAALKIATHFFVTGGKREAQSVTASVLKAIGFRRRSAKYRYSEVGVFVPFGRVTFEGIYFTILFAQYAVVAYLRTGVVPVVVLVAIALGFVNAGIARFADAQSILMLVMSAAVAFTVQHPDWWLLLSFWLLISPIPLMMQLPDRRRVFDVVPHYPPFSIQPLESAMERFLSPVREGQRVLMAFEDPGTDYDRIFDGYRNLIELPISVATRRNIHFMPDWWAVFEINYEGATDFWGRDPDRVLRNARQWRADYVVVYEPAGTPLAQAWSDTGFEAAGRFSWAEHQDDLRGERLYLKPAPDWWLLKVPVTAAPPRETRNAPAVLVGAG